MTADTPAAIKKLEEAGMETRQAEAVVTVISRATSQDGNRMLVSYKTLRRLVGVLGVTLPFVLAIGCIVCSVCCNDFKESISDYYHSNMATFSLACCSQSDSFCSLTRAMKNGMTWPEISPAFSLWVWHSAL